MHQDVTDIIETYHNYFDILIYTMKLLRYILIFIILFILLMFVIPYFINNKGVEQLGFFDKIHFSFLYGQYYKRGLVGFRNKDVVYLEKSLSNDPLAVHFYRKIQNNYKNGVAVIDTCVQKFYVVANPSILKYMYTNSPNIFGPSIMKKFLFGNVMPKNIGVTECPYSKTKICKEYQDKRDMNEEIFKTNKEIDYYDLMESSVCNNITKKIEHSNNMKEIATNIIMDLFFGHKKNELKTLLYNNYDFVDIVSDLSLKTIYYKFFESGTNMKKITNYIYENELGYSIFGMYKDYEKTHNMKLDLLNEIPHWIGPVAFIIRFYFPILLDTILKRKDVYDKLKAEINSGILNITNKKSYIHYCVVEFFRLYNIIFIQAVRKCLVDITIEGVFFQKNSEILTNTSTLLRDENEFPNPSHFIPERWEYKSVEDQHINFGFGTQRCPSINFTPLLYKIMLKHVLSNYEYKLKTQSKSTEVPEWMNGYEISFD